MYMYILRIYIHVHVLYYLNITYETGGGLSSSRRWRHIMLLYCRLLLLILWNCFLLHFADGLHIVICSPKENYRNFVVGISGDPGRAKWCHRMMGIVNWLAKGDIFGCRLNPEAFIRNHAFKGNANVDFISNYNYDML